LAGDADADLIVAKKKKDGYFNSISIDVFTL
jgi:hypothetical protein